MQQPPNYPIGRECRAVKNLPWTREIGVGATASFCSYQASRPKSPECHRLARWMVTLAATKRRGKNPIQMPPVCPVDPYVARYIAPAPLRCRGLFGRETGPAAPPADLIMALISDAQQFMRNRLRESVARAGIERLWPPSAYLGSYGDLASAAGSPVHRKPEGGISCGALGSKQRNDPPGKPVAFGISDGLRENRG